MKFILGRSSFTLSLLSEFAKPDLGITLLHRLKYNLQAAPRERRKLTVKGQ